MSVGLDLVRHYARLYLYNYASLLEVKAHFLLFIVERHEEGWY